jgi:hypothetical protein
MAFRLQLRRDISGKWQVNNPILLDGEIGYETDTTYIKIGDGNTFWNDLEYWSGGITGAGLRVKSNSTTVLYPTNTVDFSSDFIVNAIDSSSVSVSLAAGGGGAGSSDIGIFGAGGTGVTGATGIYFTGSVISSNGKFATVTNAYQPFFSVTAVLNGGNFSSFSSSKGPDGLPLTGSPWNYTLTNSGNNLTITHNRTVKPITLTTNATNGSNVFIKSPVGTSTSQFTLASSSTMNSFTVYGVNSSNTGADSSGTVELVWIFGATS